MRRTLCSRANAKNFALMQNAQPQFPASLEERYKQPRFISAGGSGAVFSALDSNLNKKVAIKLLNVNAGDQKLLRFQQEAKVIGKFTHPNIVSAMDFGIAEEKVAYLVLDLVGDASLNELIKRGETLSINKCLHIFQQICAGMTYAHAHGVLHRDLKPSNVLLENSSSEYPVAKIADFGIAKLAGTLIFATTGNIYIGTPTFTSPEQFSGADVDERADIYSFGCLMFTALQGQTPFLGGNTTELALKHANEAVPELDETYSAEEIPAALQEIVYTCLEKDPAERFDNFSQVERLVTQLQRDISDLEPTVELKAVSAEPYAVSSSSNPYSETTDSIPFQLGESKASKFAVTGAALIVVVLGLLICSTLLNSNIPPASKTATTTSGALATSEAGIPPHVFHHRIDQSHSWRQPKLPESMLDKPIPTLLETAEMHLGKREYAIANCYLDRVIEKQPNNPKGWKLRSESRKELGNYQEALSDISAAIQLKPDEKLIQRRAHLRKETGALKEALADYDYLIKLNPKSAKNHKERAKICEELSRDKEALASFSKCIELAPEDDSAHRSRGRQYQIAGEFQKAVEDFTKAIELKPKHAEYYGFRANTLMSLERYKEAAEDYTKAIEYDEDTGLYYHLRAAAYKKLGLTELAKKDESRSHLKEMESGDY
ncbi:MAG: serine/threonine-protein kinase [Candidatus Melainabacteria bacterium]|nr:serine/threonine-protein kinase [Candidatus Melainabacteria bacterium]